MASETPNPAPAPSSPTPPAPTPAPAAPAQPVAVPVRTAVTKPVPVAKTPAAATTVPAPAAKTAPASAAPKPATSAPVPKAATAKPAPVPAPSAPAKAAVTETKPAPATKPVVAAADKPAPAPSPKTASAGKPAPAAKPTTPNTAFKLPAAIYSPQLLESVIYDIQYYLDWYRQNQIRKQVGAKPKAEPNHSDETVLAIESWLDGRPATLELLEDLLAHLKGLKLPEIHITLAALPNRTQRATLVDWFRNNASSELLISFVADRNLGGGLVVRTPNHVFDFTWKQQLVASRDKLAGILKRV